MGLQSLRFMNRTLVIYCLHHDNGDLNFGAFSPLMCPCFCLLYSSMVSSSDLYATQGDLLPFSHLYERCPVSDLFFKAYDQYFYIVGL